MTKLSEDEKLVLLNLKRSAPITWRCSSIYYEIARRHGIPIDSLLPDSFRDNFIDEELEIKIINTEKEEFYCQRIIELTKERDLLQVQLEVKEKALTSCGLFINGLGYLGELTEEAGKDFVKRIESDFAIRNGKH